MSPALKRKLFSLISVALNSPLGVRGTHSEKKGKVMNHSIIMDFRSEVKCFKIVSSSFNLSSDHIRETNFRRAIARILLPKKVPRKKKEISPSLPRFEIEAGRRRDLPFPPSLVSIHPPTLSLLLLLLLWLPRPTGPTTQLS